MVEAQDAGAPRRPGARRRPDAGQGHTQHPLAPPRRVRPDADRLAPADEALPRVSEVVHDPVDDRGEDRGSEGEVALYFTEAKDSTREHLLFDTGELSLIQIAERAPPPRRWRHLPNVLTMLRALLVPLILLLLVVDTHAARWWAFGIFVFAAASDGVDGWVARRWYGVTRWGQMADPIADKVLVIGTLSALAWLSSLPWWAVIVIAVRELAITLLRVRLVNELDLVMPASQWGKIKATSQLVAVAAFLMPGVPLLLRTLLLYVAVGLTLLSALDYAFRAGRLAREALEIQQGEG